MSDFRIFEYEVNTAKLPAGAEGCLLYTSFSAAKAIEAGKVFEVETELPSVYMWSQLFYHKNKWISPQMEVFLGVAEEYFSQCGG